MATLWARVFILMSSARPRRSAVRQVVSVWHRLLRKTLHLWVRAKLVPEPIEELGIDPKRPIFYVLDTYALSSLLILEQICRQLGWADPRHPLCADGIDLPRAYGVSRRLRGLFIRAPEKRRHSRTLKRLMAQLASHGHGDVQVVPVTVLIGRAPDNEQGFFKILFSENWEVGGRLRRLFSTLINGRATMVQVGKPMSAAALLAETKSADQALGRASRMLRVHFKRVRTAAIGPDRSHRRTLVDHVVSSPSVRQAIATKAKRDGIGEEKADQIARSYAREVAADYSYTFVRLADLLLTWFWNRIYRGVRFNHLRQFREAAPGHEVVYVPCHRSHIDYLILSYLLYHHGFVPPHIAAGLNLNLPLVGPLLRRGGAFFLRRSFRSQPLYTAVFNEYVSTIISRGVAMEYFIEGTRSRTGRLLPPRVGMLSITVRAFLRYQNRPLLFQPVYIGYERLAEGNAYIRELSGHQKQPESLSDFRNLINILRKNYGEATVSFGEPIALNELLDEHHPDWAEKPLQNEGKPPWLGPLVDDLAERILVNINRAAHVNPVNLLACALLATRKHALDEDDLEALLDLLKSMITGMAYSDRVGMTEMNGAEIIEYGLHLGLIERHEHRLGNIIRTDDRQAVLLTYFRNNTAHLLAMSAWIAACFLNVQRVRRARIVNLAETIYPFLRRELFLPWRPDELGEVVERSVQTLIDLDLLKVTRDSLQRAAGGTDRAYYLRLIGNSMLQTFERYFITVSVLAKNGSGTLRRQQLEQLCMLCAQRISLLHESDAPEFYDRTLFKQFIDALTRVGFLDRNEDGLLMFGPQLERFARDAKLILSKEIRHTIIQTAPELLELANESAD